MRPGSEEPGRRPPHEAGPEPVFEGPGRRLTGEAEGRRAGTGTPGRASRRPGPRQPPPPGPAWVTKPPRPLLGDVRVGGSGGRGGGAATTTAAASPAAAFAGGRADVRGGGAPGAKRLGACGPLVAAAVRAGDGVSGDGAAGRGAALTAPRRDPGHPGRGGGSRLAREGRGRGTRALEEAGIAGRGSSARCRLVLRRERCGRWYGGRAGSPRGVAP